MVDEAYTVITALDRPDLMERQTEISRPAWPQFMLHDPLSDHWPEFYEHFPRCQFALQTSADGRLVAVGNSIPLVWEGETDDLPDAGWDWAITRSLADKAEGREPSALCALAIVVADGYRGRAISSKAVAAMQAIGREQGLQRLLVPARPTLKSRYPLVPMDRYITWTNDAGLPFDPWLRVHARLGGHIAKVCHRSMRITGTVAEWHEWTGMEFPVSGEYVVPGALVPVAIDRSADLGVYVEPNVWVVHDLR